jgi:hypothetical protein
MTIQRIARFEVRPEERHRGSAAARKFTDVLYPHTVDGVAFTLYDEIEP